MYFQIQIHPKQALKTMDWYANTQTYFLGNISWKSWHLTPLSLPSTSYSYAVLPFQISHPKISHPISNQVGIEILGPKFLNCFFSRQYISIFKTEKENAFQPIMTANSSYLGKVEICQLLHTLTLLWEGCNLRVWISNKLLKKKLSQSVSFKRWN